MFDRKTNAGLCGIAIISILIVLMFGPLTYHIDQNKQDKYAYFTLASWDYPDEHGQGINLFVFYENSTGSWVSFGSVYEPDQSYIVNWNTSGSIKLRCYAFFNSTLTGASDVGDGKNYQQHYVSVVTARTTVFSQQNFTYYNNNTVLDPMWYYGYEVVLNFIPQQGERYTVTVTYEIYY